MPDRISTQRAKPVSRRLMLCCPIVLAALGFAAPVFAQSDYPARPITLVIPFPPAGSTDVLGPRLRQSSAGEGPYGQWNQRLESRILRNL